MCVCEGNGVECQCCTLCTDFLGRAIPEDTMSLVQSMPALSFLSGAEQVRVHRTILKALSRNLYRLLSKWPTTFANGDNNVYSV